MTITKIKFCGLSRPCDIDYVNEIKPDYVGFVFYKKSRRYISLEQAEKLKSLLNPEIKSVGVFVNESPEKILSFIEILDLIQLHGSENEKSIEKLKILTHKPIIKAFQIHDEKDIEAASKSPADYILLDSGQGTGKIFNWNLIKNISRNYFLAGGLDSENVSEAIKFLNPFAIDVSSGIESDGLKDKIKMSAFANAVRNKNF